MRCMNRNKVPFWYALYDGKTRDPQTGKYNVSYRDPVFCKGNISAAKGETYTRQFGDAENYDKVLVLDELSAQTIDENSVLWVDVVPELTEDGKLVYDTYGNPKTSYDYIVRKVARSLNSISYALSKVNTT